MREDAVREFLAKAEAGWSLIEKLIARGQLLETLYKGKKFYLRKFH
jgi:butyrate kinase